MLAAPPSGAAVRVLPPAGCLSCYNQSMLTIIYIALLAVGGTLVVILLFAQRSQFMPGNQPRPPGDALLTRFLPLSLGVGMTVFGAAGLLLAPVIDQGQSRSVVVALGLGLLAAFLTQVVLYAWAVRNAPEASVTNEPDAGQEARVIIDIPAHGVGQIVYETDDGPMTIGASSAAGKAIAAGAPVTVIRSVDRMAVVEPRSTAAGSTS